MPSPASQKDLAQQLKTARAAGSPAQQRDSALTLLAVTVSREYVDLALGTLRREDVADTLSDAHHAALRAKAEYYFEHDDKDRGGLIREALFHLLIALGHAEDLDLYRAGTTIYHRQPATDAAQNLRAVALSGLFSIDRDLACAYAVRLLGEPDTSTLNGQPTMAAIETLLAGGNILPVYHFVLRQGTAFITQGMGEVVTRAIEALGRDLPRPLFAELGEHFLALNSPSALSGIASAIIEGRMDDQYPLVGRIIATTQHDDLHAYALILLAAARDSAPVAMLYRLARVFDEQQRNRRRPAERARGSTDRTRARNFVHAIELTLGNERDALLTLLEDWV